jgi:2-(1,2-epoxy-1,2-dihydrophenyl)acetyl-CoA isomerase
VTSLSTALMMVETGCILDGQQCLKYGLIDELAAAEGQALPAAMEYAKKLAQGPSVAVDLARRCVYKALTGTLDEILDYEAVAGTITANTADAHEGTKAFVEKRKAVFQGR